MYAANSYFDGCSIPQLLRRQVELRVSQINGCSYCIWVHSRQIKELGETKERLAAVEHWRASLCFSDAEKAALEWAEHVTRIADGTPPDPAFAALRHHFDDRQIVDLTAIIANMNALNRMAISFQLEAPRARRMDEI
jgi:AhpD family alkylhydroperoxidase